jgi:hypothetical protein
LSVLTEAVVPAVNSSYSSNKCSNDLVSVVMIKLGGYKIFHNDSDTIRYIINYLKVSIFDINTKNFNGFQLKSVNFRLIRNGSLNSLMNFKTGIYSVLVVSIANFNEIQCIVERYDSLLNQI